MQAGWLGWRQVRFELAPDRVVLARSWFPAWLAPCLPASFALIGWVVANVERFGQNAGPVIALVFAGVALMVAGIFGVVWMPWRAPRRLEVTRDGIALDAQHYPIADITGVGLAAKAQRYKRTTTYELALDIQLATAFPRRFRLIDARTSDPPEVMAVLAAIGRVLSSAGDGGGPRASGLPR